MTQLKLLSAMYTHPDGEMAEWSNAPVLKTGKDASPSRVRIPVSPPPIHILNSKSQPVINTIKFKNAIIAGATYPSADVFTPSTEPQ